VAATDTAGGALSRRLALAACSLLGAGGAGGVPAPAQAAGVPFAGSDDDAWSVDGSWLAYTESDDRVAVRKTLVDLQRENDAHTIGVQLVHDTMSGASPTGALADDSGQVTYTGASGGQGFAVGEDEGDGTRALFDDTRVQAGLAVESELDRALSVNYGAVVSQESDHDSFGGNVGLTRRSSDGVTTLDAGIAATFDGIYRSERDDTPEPLGDVADASSFEQGERSTVDALLGFGRVLNRRTVVQANLGLGVSSGYHSDPYKVISVVDDRQRVIAALHDSRPDQRVRATLFGKMVHRLKDSERSVNLSYRLYGDDWGVVSHTFVARYRLPLGERLFLEPHLRLYRQGAADFHLPFLAADERGEAVLPADGHASADYRLDGLTGTTLGIKAGWRIGARTDLRLRLERLEQRFDDTADGTLSATLVQTSVRYRF